ncbi:MAG: hypothetical protein L3K07_02345 [Thermoplasmata archaeon]|nr:hypothetical protein [Thermoplasmata archaeon]
MNGATPPVIPVEVAQAETPVVSARFLRWSELLFALENLPFLFFFYDAFNLNDSIYSTSLLYFGLTPYDWTHGATILVGYPLLPYNLGMLGAYGASTYNLLVTALFLKLLALAATYLAARLLLRIALRERCREWKAIYLTFLLNPFLLLVNVIWIETDVFVILALLVAFYTYHYGWNRTGDLLALACGLAALFWAGFSYFSPLLFVPTLVVYGATLRKRLSSLALAAAMGAVFAIPFLVFQFSSYTILGVSGKGSTNPYSLLQLFVPLGATIPAILSRGTLVLVGLASIVLPFVLQRWRIHVSACLVTVFAFALLATPSAVQGDNFVILTGLIPLALLFTPGIKISVARIFALELFLLPLMWIVQMFNGPGQVTGVYYWSFFVLHRNVDLFQPLGGTVVWRLCIVLVGILLAGTVAYLLCCQRTATRVTSEAPGIASAGGGGVGLPLTPRTRASSRGRVLGACLIAILVATPVVGWASTPAGFSFDSEGGFPAQLFFVHDYDAPSDYLQPAANTFSLDPGAGTVVIGSTSPSLGFIRTFQHQQFDLRMTVRLLDPSGLSVGSPVTVVNASGILAGFSNVRNLPLNLSPLAPVASGGFTPVVNPSGLLTNVTTAYETNGSGEFVYTLAPSTMPGTSLAFAGELGRYASSQTILWTISNHGIVVLEAYLVGQAFYLGAFTHGAWTYVSRGLAVDLGSWFYSGLSVDAGSSTLNAWMNGVTLSLPGVWNATDDTTLNYGKFSPSAANDGKFAFIGNLTAVYAQPTADLRYVTSAFTDPTTLAPLQNLLRGSVAQINYTGSPSSASLGVNEVGIRSTSTDPILQFGKISDSGAAVQFQFERVKISSVPPAGGLFWFVLEFAISLPAIPFVLLATRRLAPPTERELEPREVGGAGGKLHPEHPRG